MGWCSSYVDPLELWRLDMFSVDIYRPDKSSSPLAEDNPVTQVLPLHPSLLPPITSLFLLELYPSSLDRQLYCSLLRCQHYEHVKTGYLRYGSG